MIDDVHVGYIDSITKIYIQRGNADAVQEDPDKESSFAFNLMYDGMKDRASHLKHLYNHSQGVHVHQRIGACDIVNGRPGQSRSQDAFNGLAGELMHFDKRNEALDTSWYWSSFRLDESLVKWAYSKIYHPICIKILKTNLKRVKNLVMRKVKPRVRLLQKTLPDSGGAKVTCLATGFYPRHTNLTLLRDGQPVSDHQITGGELLPNGDETYQMRKSLEVSAEELQHHHYICTAEHLSLDNKLDIKLADLEPGVGTVSIVTPVVVLGVALLCVGGVFIMCRRRRRHKHR
ncbi:class II histocompatibility antigen, B-L beta chain-like [Alosa pseudoharengus]|uniref:class II histocompatibility antigen, B-L beta chain-like n=1 Tax=Alosa pseudoharengus TaxID=34774 RepID=UPI003F89A0B1